MADHKAPVPTWLNETYLGTILQKHFNEPNLKVTKMEVSAGSAAGDNYVCQIFRIKLLLEGSDTKQLSVIAKVKPDTTTAEKLVSFLDIYEIESAVFDKLLPAIKKTTIGAKNIKKFAPDCYHVDYDRSVIIMEDLGEKNFVMQKRGQFLSKEQAILVLEAFATLHGTSYKVVQKDPSFKKTFELGMWGSKKNELMDQMVNNCIRLLEKNMVNYGMSEDWCTRLNAFGERLKKDSLKICDFQEDNLNILRHGDCWMNNMLFHFTDGVPDDVILLDFQLTTYNSFSHDLHYFLFSSVDADVLVNDLDTLLETYYNKLKEVAPEIPNLTLERVKKEFNYFQFVGIVITIMCRAFICAARPADLEAMFDLEENEMGYNDPRYIADLYKLLPLMEKAGVF